VKKQIEKSGKVLMGLVNNAGIGGGLPTELHSIQDAKNMFEVNFFGMMHVTQLCLPTLRANQGRVVQVSSLAGKMATRARSVYAATKFAMEVHPINSHKNVCGVSCEGVLRRDSLMPCDWS